MRTRSSSSRPQISAGSHRLLVPGRFIYLVLACLLVNITRSTVENAWRGLKLLVIVLAATGTLHASRQAVRAGGFAIDEQGAVAMGRANAFAAQADDPSAVFYNPAGIARLSGTQISIGANLIVPSVRFDGEVTGNRTETKPALFYPFNVYAIHRLNGEWVIGLAIFSPFGLSTDWPRDWEGRYAATFSELNTLEINSSLAWNMSRRLRVAAGLSAVPSTVTLRRRLQIAGLSDGDAKVMADAIGFGFNLALMFDVSSRNRIGVTYRSPIRLALDGETNFTFPDPLVDFDEPTKSKLILPARIAFGWAVELGHGLTGEADIWWTQWSTVNEIEIDFERSSLVDSTIVKNWENSYTLRIGAEWGSLWTFRAGYAFDLTPVPSDTIDPSLPDAHRHILAAGSGIDVWKVRVDLAYMLLWFVKRGVDNEIPTGGDPFVQRGEYKTHVHQIGLNLTYVFP